MALVSLQTQQLFYPYDNREVGRYRRKIHYVSEFIEYISRANGHEDCFVSTLPGDGVVDRAHFDHDGPLSIRDAKRIFLWGTQNGFSTIPILTGKKGVQIHILSKPFRVENPKEVLTDIETYIMQQALGVKSWDDKTSIDFHLFGNIASLCRIPNTLRPPENNTYSTFLPPNFPEMSEEEIYRFSKAPHIYNYSFARRKSLLDLPYTSETEVIKESQLIEPIKEPTSSHTPFFPTDVHAFLSNILTTKRLAEIEQQNPPHRTRIITTLELLDCGLTKEEICYMYAHMGWHDYNERISRGYVNDLARRYYSGQYKLRRPD